MRKIIYKFIFIFVLVSFGLLMWPQKQIKALEQQTYPITFLKSTYYINYYEQENANTYEFIVQYVLENITIDTLNDNEYFFITEKYIALRKGINRNANTYTIEQIETGSDYTLFIIRITINKNFIDSEYGGPAYVFSFFNNDLSLYIQYDLYNEVYNDGYDIGYGEGFVDGRDYGRGIGYQEGYVDGQYEGYWSGYEEGLEDGYNQGYEAGYEEGNWYGYNEGYDIGYDLGYDLGYNNGYNKGISENMETGGFGLMLKQVFASVGSFLEIELLPGIPFGAIIAVPIVFGIIAFILGRRS